MNIAQKIERLSIEENLLILSEEEDPSDEGKNLKSSVSVPDFLDQTEDLTENLHEDDTDVTSFEWAESDLWKQTKPISVIKDISKKIKARRTSERRRLGITS